MKFFLTGFSGLIGSSFRRLLNAEHQQVVLLGREKPFLNKYESYLQYDLESSFASPVTSKDEVIIMHCAYNFSSRDSYFNSRSTLNLLKAFELTQCKKFVFFSTTIDHQDISNLSSYQSDKVQSESLFELDRDLILCPSFIFSNDSKSSKLFDAIKNFHIPIPIPKNSNLIFPIKVNALVHEIYFKLILENISGKFLIIGSASQSFASFLKINFVNLNSILPNYCRALFQELFHISVLLLKIYLIYLTFWLFEYKLHFEHFFFILMNQVVLLIH